MDFFGSSRSDFILPRRVSLVADTAAFLRDQLMQGNCGEYAPSEKELMELLQVGRNTVRAALAQLESEGLLESARGKRRRIIAAVKRRKSQEANLAVLLLEFPLPTQPLFPIRWIHALSVMLEKAGWQLQVVVSPKAFGRNPAKTLRHLCASYASASVWILHHSPRQMQEWFQRQEVRTIIAGTCYEGIALPQIDTNHRALARHAAMRFLAMGHRHLASLQSRKVLAGDMESIDGFRLGLGKGQFTQAVVDDGDGDEVENALQRLLEMPSPPSGIFILRGRHFATVLSCLLRQGIKVPAEVSLICRDHEPFLDYLRPRPFRYQIAPEVYARKLLRMTLTLGNGVPLCRYNCLLIPEHISGETLAVAPSR